MNIQVDEDELTCLACGGLVYWSDVTNEWVCLNCSTDVDEDVEDDDDE